MNMWTQWWLVFNIIHAAIFISCIFAGFWIFQKDFKWLQALKQSVYCYALLRVFFVSILLLQELF